MSLLCSCFHILHAKYRQLAGCLRCTFYYSYGLSERHLKWTNISCLVHLLINFISLDIGNIADRCPCTWYQQSKVSASSSSVRPLYFPTCSRENGITLHFNYASNPFVWHSVRCKICIQILLVLRPPVLYSRPRNNQKGLWPTNKCLLHLSLCTLYFSLFLVVTAQIYLQWQTMFGLESPVCLLQYN